MQEQDMTGTRKLRPDDVLAVINLRDKLSSGDIPIYEVCLLLDYLAALIAATVGQPRPLLERLRD